MADDYESDDLPEPVRPPGTERASPATGVPGRQRRLELAAREQTLAAAPSGPHPDSPLNWRKRLAETVAPIKPDPTPAVMLYVQEGDHARSLNLVGGLDLADIRRLSQPSLLPAYQLGASIVFDTDKGETLTYKVVKLTIGCIRAEPHVMVLLEPKGV